MGEVHSLKTPPLPSPAEAPSPVATPPSHSHHDSPQSASGSAPNEHDGYPVDENTTFEDNIWKANSCDSPILHEQALNPCHIPSSPAKQCTDWGKGCQEDQRRSLQTLKELRRQMEELLVYQQMHKSQSQNTVTREPPSSQTNPVSPSPHESSRKRRISNVSFPEVAPSSTGVLPSTSHPDSAGSIGTLKAADSPTANLPGKTPSYPFPTMQPQSTTKPVQESAFGHSPFKLTLPTEKLKINMASTQGIGEEQSASIKTPTSHSFFIPPQHKPVAEDPTYPTPNLYDLTLRLNSDPGLDAWWANVIDILKTHYGAERASLAIPGDATDLENVPWGQKAVFDGNLRTQSGNDRALSCETNNKSINTPKDGVGANEKEGMTTGANGSEVPTRPPLLSRHSFAGFGKERQHAPWNDSHTSHSQSTKTEQKRAQISNQSPDERISTGQEGRTSSFPRPLDSSNMLQHNHSQAIFPTPRPLEVEADPLIKRTGVVKLFGRTGPVVLTREYSQSSLGAPPQSQGQKVQTPEDIVQVTPTEPTHITQRAHTTRTRSVSNPSGSGPQATMPSLMELYDEYEQVPPSPWSQSPAPSPAPRAHADQNPFFISHAVDEGAFAKHPPPHDYSNTQPLEAIGVDLAKSVVHIPLLHAGRSKQTSPSTLRFPVAVISILSPIIPYPANLRQSLTYLIPHLTTSFCLAQHYSQLERQFASRLELPRYGHLLGLGGTFSDESSELELVAGLSGHVNYTIADDGTLSAHPSLSSPDDKSNSNKLSPPISGFGTPGFDMNSIGGGMNNIPCESPGVAAKVNSGSVDSYFNVKRSKDFREAITQQRSQLLKAKQSAASTPTSLGRLWGRAPADEHAASQEPGIVFASPQEVKAPSIISPTQTSTRHPSTNSFYSQLPRELPRPFTDTVAQLMLNSVPLHLFLAKPQSGEVIWTNSKFDAYRRIQPQEQKLRDPWQNIHGSEREHVSQEWGNALRTGSQFTERVRVRRFNDESAYRWFIFRANPLLSSTGEVLYWIGSFLDIHEQHIAELKATQEREKFATDAKYRAFSNSIPQVVFEATEYRGLIFVNEQWHLYTGQKLEEALNFGFAKHVHPDDLDKCGLLSSYVAESVGGAVYSEMSDAEKAAAQERFLARGVTPALDDLVRRGVASLQKDENGRVFYSTEIRLRSKGGDFRWHLVRLIRVETSSFGSGEASWYGTCTDINDRKNLERELNKAMQQLNNQMESKTKFFSNMSHEIRTPLNGILGTIPFILDTQLDTDQRRMLDTIQNSSTNLRELVDNILDVSRVEAGKMSLVNSWFHVRSVIEDVIDTISSRAIDKGLEINYLMDVDVPPMVIGDRFRVRQVLINLVGNAVKFTGQGEIHIRCSIYHGAHALSKKTELLLNFDVVDTGKGFSDRDAERLMQRFSQLGQNGSQQHAGSGLGLFLSKQLVEMHGGKLTPTSKEGQGAKFSFHIKVDAPPPPTPDESYAARQSSRSLGAQQEPNPFLKTALAPKDSVDWQGPDTSSFTSALESLRSQPSSDSDPSTYLASNTSELPSISLALPSPAFHAIDPSTEVDTTKHDADQVNASAQSRLDLVTFASGDAARSMDRPSSPLQESLVPNAPAPVQARSKAAGPPTSYSVFILCPLDNTRKAIKQHIEQVVPHGVQYSIMSTPDVEDWRDSVSDESGSKITHLVLNLPSVDDVLDVINYVSECDPASAPALVIISDLYQKRQISSRIKELGSSGKCVYTVPKPVKPSAFSAIFDPNNQRDLSKDRNQDMAREINNNFKTMSKMVKEVIGNKGYRVLLVEDDETNRMVMLKYLDKIKVMAETASNGQECTEMVFSKEPGYYSLIICDIQMPVKNGYETCRDIRHWELKNHYPQIPIMALSANAMTDQIEDAARAGFNDYVTKPIKHNELGKMMMGLLDPSRPLFLLRDRVRADHENRHRGE